MITQLYTFSPGSYVVADEWNANFVALRKACTLHYEAIEDAYAVLLFPDSDTTQFFGVLRSQPNSTEIPGMTVILEPEHEYYKILPNGQDLTINVPTGFSSESRIAIKIQDNRTLLPFSVLFSGTTQITYGEDAVFPAGIYYILIYELNGVAQVKLIWTGV
jgi:hypothetical protein